MVDMESINAAVTSLKAATDIAKAILQISNTAEVQSKVAELQAEILSAQASALTANMDQLALIERVRNLEEEVARAKAWEAEKEKYQLIEVVPAAFAYARKEDAEPVQQPHKICASCYQHGRKSILQGVTRIPGKADVLVCHQCDSEIYIYGVWRPEHGATKSASQRKR